MNTLTKIALITTALVITVVAGGVLYVFNLDPNSHKPWISDQFRELTGRELTIGGEIGLTIYPWLGISVQDIAIGNARGFGDEPMLAAAQAEVRVKLMPLLRQHYEIDTVKLYGAKISLAQHADGRNNWSDLLVGSETTDPAATPVPGTGFPLGNIILGGVDIQEGSLLFLDDLAGARYEISDFRFATDALVYGEPIDLNISLLAAASKPALSAAVGITGTLFYDLDNGRYELAPLVLESRLNGANLPGGSAAINLSTAMRVDLEADTLAVADLQLTMLDSELRASLQGQDVSTPRATFQSELQLTGNDLALLFKVAEIEPLATQLASVSNRNFALETSVSLDNGRGTATIPALQASLLGTTVTGTFQAAEILTATPSLQGKLQASGPDLPLVVEVVGQVTGGRNSPLSQAARDLRQVSSRNFAVDADFNANLRTGNIAVPTLDLRLLGATITGNLVASNVQSSSPQVRGRLVASGPDLPLLMQIGGRFQGVDSALFQNASKLTSLRNKAFSVNADFDADLDKGNITIPTLSATALGFTLEGNINSRDLNGRNGSLQGGLNLSGQNLGPLLTAFDQAELGEVLQSVSLQVGVSGSSSALAISPLTVNAVLAGSRIPNSPVTVSLVSDGQLNLDRESVVVDSFTLTGLGLNATGKLNADTIFASPTYDGELSVARFNLRQLMRQLNQALPEMADPRTLEAVAIDTSFRGTDASINLSNLNLVFDQTTLSGNLAVTNYETTNINFDLAVSELNADRYLPPKVETASTVTTPAAATELPLEQLRALNIKGEFKADRLQVSDLQLANLTLGVNATGGEVLLSPLEMNLYEGSFSGKMELDASGPQALASVTANLQRVALEPLMMDFMDASYVSGRGNVQLNLRAQGNDTNVLKSNLNGTGQIALEDGVLTGVDVASVLGQVETMLRSKRVAELQRGQQTAFDTFSATLAITNGVVASNDLLIKSPGIQITGRGTLIDLNTNTIGYNMVTSVDRSTATRDTRQYDIGGYSVPIACTGSIESPRCLPDAGEIVRTALVQEAERRVGDLLNRALGTDTQPNQPAAEPGTTDQAQPATPPADPAGQLINRALNRILNN